MNAGDSAGTAAIPYPDIFTEEPDRFWQRTAMEGELLAFIDIAATSGPALIGDGHSWRWLFLPWNSDQRMLTVDPGLAAVDRPRGNRWARSTSERRT